MAGEFRGQACLQIHYVVVSRRARMQLKYLTAAFAFPSSDAVSVAGTGVEREQDDSSLLPEQGNGEEQGASFQ